MNWLVDILVLLGVLIIITIWIIVLRKRLLRLWQEVTGHEVAFYRQLEKVIRLFYEHLTELTTEDNQEYVRLVKRYRKKKIRSLLLSTRQELYNAINLIFDEVEESSNTALKIVIEEFENLQKVRRIYNSRVLIYNQTISVFPTRYLALRMNLELKEYFG